MGHFILLSCSFNCNKRRIIAQNGSPLTPHPHGKNDTIVFWPLPFTYPSLYKRCHVCPTNDHPRKTIPIKGNSIWRKLRHWTAKKIQYLLWNCIVVKVFNTLFHGQVPVKISHFCFLFIRNIHFILFWRQWWYSLYAKKKGYSYLDKFLTEQSHSIFMVFGKKFLKSMK